LEKGLCQASEFPPGVAAVEVSPSPGPPNAAAPQSSEGSAIFVVPSPGDIKLLAIDMDGTLLNSSSEVTARTAKALRAAMDHGLKVVLATGKARPAAIAALEAVGLAGAPRFVGSQRHVRRPCCAFFARQSRCLTDAARLEKV